MPRTKHAWAGLRDLCSLGLPAETLVPALLEALHDWVPSSRNLFDWTDAQGRLVRYFIEGPVDEAVARRYFEEFHNHREAEVMPVFAELRRMPAGVRPAAELDHAAFRRSALYQEIWRPQGFDTRLEAVLRGRRGQLLGSLVLYRAPGEVPFTRDDERRLAEVLPLLATALETAGEATLDEPLVPDREPAQSLLATLSGQLVHATDGALRLLRLAEGGLSPAALLAAPLPHGVGSSGLVTRLLDRLREQLHLRPGHALPPQVLASRFGPVRGTAHLMRPLAPERAAHRPVPPEALAQLTMQRLEPHRVALERALRALPLTAGQRAVGRGLYHGRQQGDIARTLGVAPATVIDHVRKLYRALEVASALELRALLDRRIGYVPARMET